ncbi:hypothetical protein A3H38_04205 [candidate division WOR-1 bacterium RIFCSPLOWO2_02_FULL_46_20]|uniref:Uncharacterized protein n=1 Tax=candidate division WOR-1 bacterium RIFCSPLOWO2_02_FULL_46_20 TaxID=1802567 RepID=A0A1F4REW8_UNCSA|nr:MAG: hypothetical protein A3J44_03025 [candidate division WOR-1 bacterium RIFCSPHIGHO2_02_FULL_45_12]OGC06053.1 MAG: hypothetical protein A3H38_04205 [candidate division WOR-1 bacterium RIFCSPLOWO2_02_FULL_46_20]
MAGLRVNIEGLRFRASDGKLGAADQLRIVNQRLSNPAALRLRAGDSPAALAEIISQRQPVALKISEVDNASAAAEVGAAAVSQASKIGLPKMIDDSRLPFKVAKGVVPGSLSNGRTVAAEINRQNPGSNLRVPTEPELEMLNRLLGDQLEGTEYWIWTGTEHGDYPGQFVLRPLGDDRRYCGDPDYRYGDDAVRFVEDR